MKTPKVILMAMFALLFAACSDDEGDEPNSNSDISNGFVKVEYTGASTYSLYAYDAHWNAGHQEVNGTVLDYLKSGATFIVDLSENSPSEVEKVFDDYFYEITATWQFATSDEVKEGAEIDIDSSHWNDGSFDNSGYFCHDCSGTVIVKSVKNNQVTLQFKDFKFDRITSFSVGNSSYQDLIVNGDITFNYEEN